MKRSLRPKLRPDDLPPMENASSRPGDVATRGPQPMPTPKMQMQSNAKAAAAKKKKQMMARQGSMVEAQEGMPSPADENNEAKSMLQGFAGGMKKGGGVKKMNMGGKIPGYKAGKSVRGYGKARGAKACKMV